MTARVAAGGSGTYAVANLQAGTGLNRFGGWALVVAYRLASDPPRRLMVDDGLLALDGTARPATDVPFSGFLTPAAGARGAIYRAHTRLLRTRGTRRPSRTFSLPAPVTLH